MAFENLGQSTVPSQVSLLADWDCKQEVTGLETRSRKGILLGQRKGKEALCSWRHSAIGMFLHGPIKNNVTCPFNATFHI